MKKCVVIVSIILPIISFFILYEWRTWHGYCHSQNRYLENEDLMNSVLEGVISVYNQNGNEVYGINIDSKIDYTSIESFKKINLDCCEPIFDESWKSRVTDANELRRDAYRVDISFKYDLNNEYSLVKVSTRVGVCGDAFRILYVKQ